MKVFKKEHQFINFLLFALLAIAINLVSGLSAGYASVYTTTIYIIGSTLLVGFILLYIAGYRFIAKLLSALFFNAFFFIFSYYYGLRAIVFMYYFPFLVSYIYMYKNNTNKNEAKIFTCTCFAFLIAIFIICPMSGEGVLTHQQEVIMFKKNFLVSFALSAYYFNAIFSYLIVQMKLAREASASKARFLSIMSHELRTPLNGIISSINLMEATQDEKEIKKYTYVLKSSSEHLLHLVNNVLDYSKASAGKMELQQVSCSINNLLTNLQAVFQPRFEEKGLLLEVIVDKELRKTVLLDDIRFVQVLTNLISNALKFTDTGKVVIAAKCKAVKESTIEVEVSVTDTGKGMNKDQQERIFESFNTLEKQTRGVESTGLGLSISQMIVEMLGAKLLLESQEDVGSKFYFNVTIPLALAEEKKIIPISEDYTSLEGARVLIAEDNPINMMVTREFLKKWKVTTIEAVNGYEAQKLLIKNPDIDLLLLDLQMPEMNGYELMQWIREHDHELPVLAFTAQIMLNKEKSDLIQLGFTDMIPKPFAPEELQRKMKSALAKSRQVTPV